MKRDSGPVRDCGSPGSPLCGAILIELALVIPVIFMLVGAVVGFGLRFVEDQALTMAVQAGARLGNNVLAFDVVNRRLLTGGATVPGSSPPQPLRLLEHEYCNLICDNAVAMSRDQIERLGFNWRNYDFQATVEDRLLTVTASTRGPRVFFFIPWFGSGTSRRSTNGIRAEVPIGGINTDCCCPDFSNCSL